jgi:hypothetical protein
MEPSDLQAFKAPADPPLMPGGASEGIPGGNHDISTIIYIYTYYMFMYNKTE